MRADQHAVIELMNKNQMLKAALHNLSVAYEWQHPEDEVEKALKAQVDEALSE